MQSTWEGRLTSIVLRMMSARERSMGSKAEAAVLAGRVESKSSEGSEDGGTSER